LLVRAVAMPLVNGGQTEPLICHMDAIPKVVRENVHFAKLIHKD